MVDLYRGASNPLDETDEFTMQILDNFIKILKSRGVPGIEALQRMAFQATLGTYMVADIENGPLGKLAPVEYLFKELQAGLKDRGLTLTYSLVTSPTS